MLRSVLAVIAGYAATGALELLTGLMLTFLKLTNTTGAAKVRLLLFSLVFSAIYSIAGGAFCVKVKRSRERSLILALIILGEVLGLVMVFTLFQEAPIWYRLGILVVHPPAVLLGARLGTLWLRWASPADAS